MALELEARLEHLLSTAQEETKDIDLFAPINITEREECPICMIPLPYNEGEIIFKLCCGKKICRGCIHKHYLTLKAKSDAKGDLVKNLSDLAKLGLCAFCRQPVVIKDNGKIKQLKKLMKKNNTQAFMMMADQYNEGQGVIQSNTRAVEMYIRAAELGDADAYGNIGLAYELGDAVEQNISKSLEFYEVSAKKGSIVSHKHLASFLGNKGDILESIQHLKITACAGDKHSMDYLMEVYKDNLLTKEELTRTLRLCQASNNAMKSNDRDDARAMRETVMDFVGEI